MASFDSKSDYLRTLMFILDLALVALVYIASVKAYPYLRPDETIDEFVHLGMLPIVLIIFGLARHYLGRGQDIQRLTLWAQTIRIIQQVLLTVGALGLIVFLLKLESISRVVVVIFAVAALMALNLVRRFIVWWYISRPSGAVDNHLRVLIVGSGRRARLLADQLPQSSEWGVHVGQ